MLDERYTVAWKTGEILTRAVDQVVDDRDARTLPGELPHELRPDETGAAGHNRGFPRAHRIIRGESEYGRAASVEPKAARRQRIPSPEKPRSTD